MWKRADPLEGGVGHVDVVAQLRPTPHPLDMPFSSLPQVQRFDKYSRNAALGEVRVALRELKASRSLAVCAELQETTKVIND